MATDLNAMWNDYQAGKIGSDQIRRASMDDWDDKEGGALADTGDTGTNHRNWANAIVGRGLSDSYDGVLEELTRTGDFTYQPGQKRTFGGDVVNSYDKENQVQRDEAATASDAGHARDDERGALQNQVAVSTPVSAWLQTLAPQEMSRSVGAGSPVRVTGQPTTQPIPPVRLYGTGQPVNYGRMYATGQPTDFGDTQSSLIAALQKMITDTDARNKARGDSLFSTLQGKINQSLNVDRNDAVIRGQADAYSANEERQRRNIISDASEASGPNANLRGVQRMAAERAGQRSGQFEADLIGREVGARRDEAAQGMAGALGVVSGEQGQQLAREMSLLDNYIKQQGIGVQHKGIDKGWETALMGNDLDLRRLGLQDWDRSTYYDLVQRGLA